MMMRHFFKFGEDYFPHEILTWLDFNGASNKKTIGLQIWKHSINLEEKKFIFGRFSGS